MKTNAQTLTGHDALTRSDISPRGVTRLVYTYGVAVMARRLLRLALLLGAWTLLFGCSASPTPRTLPSATAHGGPDKAKAKANSVLATPTLRVQSLRGPLFVQLVGETTAIALGAQQERAAVRTISARHGAALAALVDAQGRERGKLWLRAGAELRWGQTASGELEVSLRGGDARLSLFDLAQTARLRDGARLVAISGQDVLLTASKQGVTVAPTAFYPAAAEWTLALLEKPQAAGVGTLSVRGVPSADSQLELRSLAVTATISGGVAETRVEHVFYNGSQQNLEGTFRFPLPAGASLTGLAMEINGKLQQGELVERKKAQAIYQSIVDSMRDPALLEWEQGNTFKLRVFPIEAQREKRVVLTYLAPLERTPQGQLRFRYDTAAPSMQARIPRFSLQVDGKRIVATKNYRPGLSLAVPLPRVAAAAAFTEARKDGVYTALTVRPAWTRLLQAAQKTGKLSSSKSAPPRDLLLLVDTSRSSLESRPLQLSAVRELLASLRPTDRFLVTAMDLTTRDHARGFVPATAAARKQALAFLAAIEPDGATDLGAALRQVGIRLAARPAAEVAGRATQLIYLGDGTVTWGQTEIAALTRLAAEQLGETPLHALVLGKGAHRELVDTLCAKQGGRVAAPRDLRGVRRLALTLSRPDAPRLVDVALRAGEQDEIFPRHAPTLFYGETLTVLVHTPAGKPVPRQLTLSARLAGEPVVLELPARSVQPARHVAHRWARAKLAALSASGAKKDVIVATSLRYGVLSRHTAFLVLESEEAYKRFGIQRRKQQQQQQAKAGAPKVTGGDLETFGAPRARLSPDHLQPGDPEVRIPAPADAQSVVVVFPFGETKIARYEPTLRAWTVRFLVAQDTPDGTYPVIVRITHASGQVEIVRLSYVVDSSAPLLKLRVVRRGRAYAIIAAQVVTKSELLREHQRQQIASGARVTTTTLSGRQLSQLRQRYAEIVPDLKRVEVQLPDGRVLRLRAYKRSKRGQRGGTWRPRSALQTPVLLKVVAVDIALNRRVTTYRFDPADGSLTEVTR